MRNSPFPSAIWCITAIDLFNNRAEGKGKRGEPLKRRWSYLPGPTEQTTDFSVSSDSTTRQDSIVNDGIIRRESEACKFFLRVSMRNRTQETFGTHCFSRWCNNSRVVSATRIERKAARSTIVFNLITHGWFYQFGMNEKKKTTVIPNVIASSLTSRAFLARGAPRPWHSSHWIQSLMVRRIVHSRIGASGFFCSVCPTHWPSHLTSGGDVKNQLKPLPPAYIIHPWSFDAPKHNIKPLLHSLSKKNLRRTCKETSVNRIFVSQSVFKLGAVQEAHIMMRHHAIASSTFSWVGTWNKCAWFLLSADLFLPVLTL